MSIYGSQATHGRNLLESLKEIPVFPIPPRFGAPGAPKSISDDDMGKNDLNTINYINIKTNDIPPGHEARIKEIEEMMDLTHRWLDIHAGIQTKIQTEKGALPTDMSLDSQLKRSNYRIKVVDTIMTGGSCGWINVSRDEVQKYTIKCQKAEFHTQLLKHMLQDITTVEAISPAIEGVLKSLSDIIVQCKDSKQEKLVWTFLNVFSWDDVTNSVQGSIRIIWYKISGEMVEYVVHKRSYEEVCMEFGFHRTDYTFVEVIWEMIKKSVLDFLVDYGNKKVRDPIDGGEITPSS